MTEELSVTFPEIIVSNQAEHPEIEVPLIAVDSTTEEVREVEGHDETHDVNNQVTDDVVVSVPETWVYKKWDECWKWQRRRLYSTAPSAKQTTTKYATLRFDGPSYGFSTVLYVSSVQTTNQTFPPQQAFWPKLLPTHQYQFSPPTRSLCTFPFPLLIPPVLCGYRYYW